MFGIRLEPSTVSINCVYKKERLWQDCSNAQACQPSLFVCALINKISHAKVKAGLYL